MFTNNNHGESDTFITTFFESLKLNHLFENYEINKEFVFKNEIYFYNNNNNNNNNNNKEKKNEHDTNQTIIMSVLENFEFKNSRFFNAITSQEDEKNIINMSDAFYDIIITNYNIQNAGCNIFTFLYLIYFDRQELANNAHYKIYNKFFNYLKLLPRFAKKKELYEYEFLLIDLLIKNYNLISGHLLHYYLGFTKNLQLIDQKLVSKIFFLLIWNNFDFQNDNRASVLIFYLRGVFLNYSKFNIIDFIFENNFFVDNDTFNKILDYYDTPIDVVKNSNIDTNLLPFDVENFTHQSHVAQILVLHNSTELVKKNNTKDPLPLKNSVNTDKKITHFPYFFVNFVYKKLYMILDTITLGLNLKLIQNINSTKIEYNCVHGLVAEYNINEYIDKSGVQEMFMSQSSTSTKSWHDFVLENITMIEKYTIYNKLIYDTFVISDNGNDENINNNFCKVVEIKFQIKNYLVLSPTLHTNKNYIFKDFCNGVYTQNDRIINDINTDSSNNNPVNGKGYDSLPILDNIDKFCVLPPVVIKYCQYKVSLPRLVFYGNTPNNWEISSNQKETIFSIKTFVFRFLEYNPVKIFIFDAFLKIFGTNLDLNFSKFEKHVVNFIKCDKNFLKLNLSADLFTNSHYTAKELLLKKFDAENDFINSVFQKVYVQNVDNNTILFDVDANEKNIFEKTTMITGQFQSANHTQQDTTTISRLYNFSKNYFDQVTKNNKKKHEYYYSNNVKYTTKCTNFDFIANKTKITINDIKHLVFNSMPTFNITEKFVSTTETQTLSSSRKIVFEKIDFFANVFKLKNVNVTDTPVIVTVFINSTDSRHGVKVLNTNTKFLDLNHNNKTVQMYERNDLLYKVSIGQYELTVDNQIILNDLTLIIRSIYFAIEFFYNLKK